MKCSSRPQQKGLLGGALPGTWNRPAPTCNCLMEQLGVLSESSKQPLQEHLSVSDQNSLVSQRITATRVVSSWSSSALLKYAFLLYRIKSCFGFVGGHPVFW